MKIKAIYQDGEFYSNDPFKVTVTPEVRENIRVTLDSFVDEDGHLHVELDTETGVATLKAVEE